MFANGNVQPQYAAQRSIVGCTALGAGRVGYEPETLPHIRALRRGCAQCRAGGWLPPVGLAPNGPATRRLGF